MRVRRFATALSCAALLLGPVLAGSVAAADPASPPGERPAPAASARGHWTVSRVATDVYRLAWRSPVRLPVTSDRPVVRLDGAVLGAGRVSGDGRTVSLEVRTTTPPDPSRLDVLLSGDRLDVRGRDRLTSPVDAAATPTTTPLPDDPATPGPYAVSTSDYVLDPVKLAGMPEPIELVGHVVEPEAGEITGPRPLVLFQHGRHGYCYDPTTGDEGWRWPCSGRFQEIPSHLGYDYIQQVLASQGFATVSVRVNGINAQDWKLADGGADARAGIVQRHLDHWADGLAAESQVDLTQVVLVGHSRGGEGVNRASIQIPLTAPYRVVGQVLLAPTNFGTQTAAYVPTVTVLPYCDGDVIDLQGQRFTDSARDLTRDDTSLKSSALVMGANHNFFNTEWTPGVAVAPSFDDWWGDPSAECGADAPTRLTDAEQRSVGVAYVAGAARLFAQDAQEFLPMYDGSPVHVASTGSADVRSAAIGGGAELRRPGFATGRTLPDGAVSRFCDGVVRPRAPVSVCGRDTRLSTIQTPHWPDAGEFVQSRQELEISWTGPGQSAGLLFDVPLDLSGHRLALRTIVDPNAGDAGLRLRLTDAAGATADLDPVGGTTLPALPLGEGLGKRWAQSLVADASTASGIDLTQVVSVDLVSLTDQGRVWVLDVAAAPHVLATVPDRRLPLVDLSRVKVTEGDGPGTVEANVPFTVTGDLTGRASFTVGVVSYDPRAKPYRVPVDLAPGQASGSVSLTYPANKVDDFPRRLVAMVASPSYGVMTDGYFGGLMILDDDPAPRISATPSPRTVSEGSKAVWRVRLSKPTGYDLGAYGKVVPGPRKTAPLRVGDVRRWWVKAQLGRVPRASKPLYKLGLYVGQPLRAGRTTVDIMVPTRGDRLREGRESVTLRLQVGKKRFTRTVFVQD